MNLLVAFAAGLVFAALLLRIFENHFIYFPPRYPEGFADPRTLGLGVEEVWFAAQDGVKLHSWLVPNPASEKVLLIFHGNAENLGLGLPRLKAFTELGINLFAVDYRGYGKSEGSPDEVGVYRDAEAAYLYLTQSRGFQPKNILIYGQSLGGAVAIDIASRYECGGLIVEGTFTSGRDMARRMFRIPLLEYVPKSRFDSLAKIKRVHAPILIVHGTHDEVVPFWMGQKLYESAPEPKSFLSIPGAGHNDVLRVGGTRYLDSLKARVGMTNSNPLIRAVKEKGGGGEIR